MLRIPVEGADAGIAAQLFFREMLEEELSAAGAVKGRHLADSLQGNQKLLRPGNHIQINDGILIPGDQVGGAAKNLGDFLQVRLTDIPVIHAGGNVVCQLADLVGEDIGSPLFTLADIAALLEGGQKAGHCAGIHIQLGGQLGKVNGIFFQRKDFHQSQKFLGGLIGGRGVFSRFFHRIPPVMNFCRFQYPQYNMKGNSCQ